ncbi:GtrA family protein [Diaphorobacter sp.]|uniref:GtrA family protein n=1 Tax=Diaphorobacter sp. TaxID=1934310 RepID=UPI00258FC9AF|nr:GtrA family protein [Diaphorobacter sp.]
MRPLRQFIWFAVAGTIGFVVDVGLLYATAEFLGWYGARIFSFAGAVTATWFINRHLTFRTTRYDKKKCTDKSLIKEYFKYILSMLGGALINYSAYALILSNHQNKTTPLLGVAAGSIAGLFVNFFLAKYYVFRSKTRNKALSE